MNVDSRGTIDPPVTPGRLGLLEVYDVHVSGELAHARHELTVEPVPWPLDPRKLPTDTNARRHVDHFDGDIVGDGRCHREVLAGGNRLYLDTVKRKPAEECQRAPSGCVPLRERWLRKDDQDPHRRSRPN
jgi:hypothetical protein